MRHSIRTELSLSPNRLPGPVIESLRQQDEFNTLTAYQVQKILFKLFMHPQIAELPRAARRKLTVIQAKAFDSFSPTPEDLNTLSAYSDENGDPRTIEKYLSDTVHHLRAIMEEGRSFKQELRKLGIHGDELRDVIDMRAGNILAQEQGGGILVFGSARLGPETEQYQNIQWLTRTLVEGMLRSDGKTERIITGGGPAIMEAANSGAVEGKKALLNNLVQEYQNGGRSDKTLLRKIKTLREMITSIGIRIELPYEQGFSPDLEMNLTIKAFFTRKKAMFATATGRSSLDEGAHTNWHGNHPAVFIGEGGIGTADEGWEALCLTQCKKMPPVRVYLIGDNESRKFYGVMKIMEKQGTISSSDLDLIQSSADPAAAIIHFLDDYQLDMPPTIEKYIDTWRKEHSKHPHTVTTLMNGAGI